MYCSRAALKYASTSSRVMPAVSATTAAFHLRDSATALNLGSVPVVINELLWSDDTHVTVAVQQVYAVEAFLALGVDEVLEVPRNEVFDPGYGAGGDVAGVVKKVDRQDALADVSGGQLFRCVADGQDSFHGEGW